MTPPLSPVTSPTGATVSAGATDAPADAWRTPTGPVIDALHETARLQREARARVQDWTAHVAAGGAPDDPPSVWMNVSKP